MCGRLACTLAPGEIKRSCICNDKDSKDSKGEFIDVSNYYEYSPFYNGPPTTVVPVLAWKTNFPDSTKQTDSTSDICLISMRWGMIPIYQTEKSGSYHTHNARIEGVLKSPLYKPCLRSGKRCVVLANGYYEWKTTDGENHKEPYFIYQTPDMNNYADLKIHDNKYVMKLAGLFNVIREGSIVKYTCTIITRESDESMSWLHHRIPIVLDSMEDIENWLNPEKYNYEEALKKLPVYTQEKPRSEQYKLRYHIVDKSYVNKSTCNDAKCMEQKTLKRKSVNTLDGWLKKAKK